MYLNNNAVKKHYSVLLILKKDVKCMSRFRTFFLRRHPTPYLARRSIQFYGIDVNYLIYFIFYGIPVNLTLTLSLRSLESKLKKTSHTNVRVYTFKNL